MKWWYVHSCTTYLYNKWTKVWNRGLLNTPRKGCYKPCFPEPLVSLCMSEMKGYHDRCIACSCYTLDINVEPLLLMMSVMGSSLDGKCNGNFPLKGVQQLSSSKGHFYEENVDVYTTSLTALRPIRIKQS